MEINTSIFNPNFPEDFVLEAFKFVLKIPLYNMNALGTTCFMPRLEEDILHMLIAKALPILKAQPPLLELNGEVIIIGDIHGNLPDLLRIIRTSESPQNQKYLFLGDYIDRGQYSIEVIVILIAFVIKKKDSIFLLRGNHEFEELNSSYGFSKEIEQAGYSKELFKKFNQLFDYLSYAALINKVTFCVHGGISQRITKVSEINQIQKPVHDYLSNPLVNDLIWSDPIPDINGYKESVRKSGHHFGPDVVMKFIKDNELKHIFRAHQCVGLGFEQFQDTPLFTVFSSSCYTPDLNNYSGYITLLGDCFIDCKLRPLHQEEKKEKLYVKVTKDYIPEILQFSAIPERSSTKNLLTVPQTHSLPKQKTVGLTSRSSGIPKCILSTQNQRPRIMKRPTMAGSGISAHHSLIPEITK